MRPTFAFAVMAALALGCDGRDRLLANLQSARPDARAAAIRKLADQSRPEDLVLFTRAAKDTAPIVRGEAASALGSSLDPRVVDVLGELLGDADELVQGKAAMALARIRTDQAKKYLTLQYARRGLGYTGDARAVEPIAELLAENFPELREAATEALVRLRDPKALPRLKEIALEKSTASAFATTAIIALPADARTNAALCEIALEAAPEDARVAGRAMRTRGGCPLDPILDKLGRRAEQLAALYALDGLGKTA